MKHYTIQIALILGLLITLPSCNRLVDWAKDSVYQGEQITTDLAIPQEYVRSAVIHDQLETAAIFDALWLSHDVKVQHARIMSIKQGKTQERHKSFLRRQLEESKHYITVYVLSTSKVILGDVQSVWTMYLDIDGRIISPVEIKPVDMDAVYQTFFGKRYNRFKVPYKVKFDAKDAEEHPYIQPDTQSLTLVIRSFAKEARFSWPVIDADKGVIPVPQETVV